MLVSVEDFSHRIIGCELNEAVEAAFSAEYDGVQYNVYYAWWCV